MVDTNVIKFKNPEAGTTDLLTTVIRNTAKEMIAYAGEAELREFIKQHEHLSCENGKKRVVRNGYLPERTITTGVGSVDVKVPRVRDRKEVSDTIKFNSQIVPKHLRRSASMDELLPLLYLKGVSTNDFQQALEPLVGKEAKNISPAVISRLKSSWINEYNDWRKIDLSDKNYVYLSSMVNPFHTNTYS